MLELDGGCGRCANQALGTRHLSAQVGRGNGVFACDRETAAHWYSSLWTTHSSTVR